MEGCSPPLELPWLPPLWLPLLGFAARLALRRLCLTGLPWSAALLALITAGGVSRLGGGGGALRRGQVLSSCRTTCGACFALGDDPSSDRPASESTARSGEVETRTSSRARYLRSPTAWRGLSGSLHATPVSRSRICRRGQSARRETCRTLFCCLFTKHSLSHPFDSTASQSKISRSDRSDGRERRERSRTTIDARTQPHQTWPPGPATGTPPPLLACLQFVSRDADLVTAVC